VLFSCGESWRSTVRVPDLPASQARTARAAVARLTTVRQVQSCRERCVEHRLPGADADRPAVRLDPDSVVVRAQSSVTAIGLD
jgi:hypothetical protein